MGCKVISRAIPHPVLTLVEELSVVVVVGLLGQTVQQDLGVAIAMETLQHTNGNNQHTDNHSLYMAHAPRVIL